MMNKKTILYWIDQINAFLRKSKIKIDPLPEIILDDSKKNDIGDVLISTGGYQPELRQLVLMIDNRHIKDILRSYCHEMVHHCQNLDNSDYLIRIMCNSGDLVNSPALEEIEGEAYLKGNLWFRKFTEKLKKDIKKR